MIIKYTGPYMPKFATSGSSGMDLLAVESFILKPSCAQLVKTGIFMEIPHGFEGQVRSKSGLTLNRGVVVLNSPGTVDSDYRGEIGVILFNHSQEPQAFNKGDKIAQLVICPIIPEGKMHFRNTLTLTTTERGDGGFGHTGK